jgi:hypothetical protein
MTLVERLAGEVLERGTYTALEGASPHAAFNELMTR